MTQSLRFTAPFPRSPRQRERKHCQWQYKTKRERCLSKLNSFSFSFCTYGAACALYALVIPAGFEPTTHSLEGCCSIQLSYGTISDYLQRLSPIHHKAPKGAPSWPLKWLFGSFCAAKVIKIYQFAKSLLLTPQFCRSAPSPTHSHNPGSWRSVAACLAAHSRWPPS